MRISFRTLVSNISTGWHMQASKQRNNQFKCVNGRTQSLRRLFTDIVSILYWYKVGVTGIGLIGQLAGCLATIM